MNKLLISLLLFAGCCGPHNAHNNKEEKALRQEESYKNNPFYQFSKENKTAKVLKFDTIHTSYYIILEGIDNKERISSYYGFHSSIYSDKPIVSGDIVSLSFNIDRGQLYCTLKREEDK